MNKKLIGILLLVGGGILGYMGYQERASLDATMKEAVNQDKLTDTPNLMLGGGVVGVLLGGILVLKGGGDKKKQ